MGRYILVHTLRDLSSCMSFGPLTKEYTVLWQSGIEICLLQSSLRVQRVQYSLPGHAPMT